MIPSSNLKIWFPLKTIVKNFIKTSIQSLIYSSNRKITKFCKVGVYVSTEVSQQNKIPSLNIPVNLLMKISKFTFGDQYTTVIPGQKINQVNVPNTNKRNI